MIFYSRDIDTFSPIITVKIYLSRKSNLKKKISFKKNKIIKKIWKYTFFWIFLKKIEIFKMFFRVLN